MYEGATLDLICSAGLSLVLCLWISRRLLSWPAGFLVSLVKVTIPFVYFSWCYSGAWTFLDDQNYFSIGYCLVKEGYGPFSVLCTNEGLERLMGLCEGRHILYAWWNVLAQSLLGSHYYAPVFLNVPLTAVCGRILTRVMKEDGFDVRYQKGFYIFFLLQWDILAWSSLINLKDILTMTLCTWCLALVLGLARKLRVHLIIGICVSLSLFLLLRFYMILLVAASALLWLVARRLRPQVLVGGVVLATVVSFLVPIEYRLEEFYSNEPLVVATVRFLLTPRPWSIEEATSFLYIPSILNWCFAIPSLLAALVLWRRSTSARLFLLFLLITSAFYAMTILAGPRQRLQVEMVLSWAQFHAVWMLIENVGRLRRKPKETPPAGC